MHDALRAFLRDSGLAKHMHQWPVFEAWSQAVGRDIARRARPVQFTRGQLCIEVDSAAHLHELTNFTGERFRELANAHLRGEVGTGLREQVGKPEIQRVVFRLKR
jgi:hypothetical protein